MGILLKIFLKNVLVNWARYFGLAFVGIVLVAKIFDNSTLPFGLAIYIGLVLLMTQSSQLTARNLNWILFVPVSKKDVLLFNYLFSFIQAAVFGVGCFLLAYFVNKSHPFSDLKPMLSGVARDQELARGVGTVARSRFFLGELSVLLIFLTMIHCWALLIYHPEVFKKNAAQYWSTKNTRQRIKLVLLGTLTLLVGAFLFYFESEFWFAIGALFLGPLVVLWFSTGNLKMPLRSRWIGMAVSGTVSVSFALGLYLGGMKIWKGGTAVDRVKALNYFGINFIKPKREEVVQLIRSEIPEQELIKLVSYYKKEYLLDQKISPSEDKILNWSDLIQRKEKYSEITPLFALIDLQKVPREDFEYLMKKFPAQVDRKNLIFPYLSNALTEKEVLALYQSSHPTQIILGLIAARYHRFPSLISLSHALLNHPRDVIKLEALKTLSVLRAKETKLDYLLQYAQRRSLASVETTEGVPIECKNFTVSSTLLLKETDMGVLNVCLRDRSKGDFGLMSELENSEWISWPLSESDKGLIRKVFHSQS